jgi:hypothetical protein
LGVIKYLLEREREREREFAGLFLASRARERNLFHPHCKQHFVVNHSLIVKNFYPDKNLFSSRKKKKFIEEKIFFHRGEKNISIETKIFLYKAGRIPNHFKQLIMKYTVSS